MRVIADYDGTNGIFSATLDIVGKCSVKSILTDENGTVIAESNEKESVNLTIENNTFSIQAQDSVFQFKSAESNLGSADLDFISAFVCQNHCKRVEIRYFGTPRLAIFNCPVYSDSDRRRRK